ncbi:hypothetical protein ACMZOO_04980 [Catenovulum sp. SX2]|uniref:hypothetical protein n=1 Tax=Catenovulum sp. SX2 TaxID=3398614 RepID=UPI003F876F9A
MKSNLKYFQNNPPRCLESFIVKAIGIENLEYDGHGEDLNSVFEIECRCGNEKYKVSGFNWINPDNQNSFFVGPLSLDCTGCNSINEIFNIEKHGYDSELGHGCYGVSGEGEHSYFVCELCERNTFKIMARFEFTNDLFDDDFPEARGKEKDLFTWFSLHGVCSSCLNIVQICDYECA